MEKGDENWKGEVGREEGKRGQRRAGERETKGEREGRERGGKEGSEEGGKGERGRRKVELAVKPDN